MWRQVHEALDYLQHYRGQTFVIKIGKQVALRAEEVGVMRNIKRLRGHGVRMVVIHAVADLDISRWPSLILWADKRGIDNVAGIRATLLDDRVPVVYSGKGREESSDKHAAALAVNLGANKLLFLTDCDGVADADGLLIRQLTADGAKEYLRQSRAGSDSIAAKLECAISAFEHGIDRAHIINGLQEDALFHELLTSEGIGTMIYGREPYIDNGGTCVMFCLENFQSEKVPRFGTSIYSTKRRCFENAKYKASDAMLGIILNTN